MIGALLVALGVALRRGPAVAPVPVSAVVEAADVVMPPDRLELGIRVRRGSTLGGLLLEWGVDPAPVIEAALPLYDLARIRPDRELSVVLVDGDPVPVAVRYEIDEDNALVVSRSGEQWTAAVDAVQYTSALGSRDVLVTRSLWADGLDAGLRPGDLVRLAQIFEYEIDFNTELRDGARFSLVADVLSAEGRADRLGELYAVRIENAGKEYIAIRHAPEGGEVGWFHPDGTGMKKPFLRSPLEFSRVTSGFDLARFHPILKKQRPHYGTDFGAPEGTPVRVVAEGVVRVAGVNGGHGRYVEVEHDGRYRTSYSHLSRIRVKTGQRVAQGTILGAVGQTGLATGPHLHFQMWRDGRFVDPMKIELPNTAPLAAAERESFAREVARWLPLLPGEREGDVPLDELELELDAERAAER